MEGRWAGFLVVAVFLTTVPINLAFLPSHVPSSAASCSWAHTTRGTAACRKLSISMGKASRAALGSARMPSVAGVRAAAGSTAGQQMSASSPLIYDGTLTQRQSDFLVEDKIKVAQMLHEFGMHYIEGGWPTVSPQDRAFFVRARDELEPACFRKLVAMAPVRAADVEAPAAVADALLKTGAANVGVALNVASKAGMHKDELEKTLKLLSEGKPAGGKLIVHLHNAMHSYREDAGQMSSLISFICKCGADFVILVDSGGTATPWEIEKLVGELLPSVAWGETQLGIHCRDDAELSVAATLYAAKQGAHMLVGTVNGFGGSVDLATVIPVLQIKMGHALVSPAALADLTRLSRAIDEQANLPHRNSQPFVGNSAFAHKGGIHVAAVLKNEDSYQHINPAVVGNKRRVLISELSGRGNIMSKVEELGMLGQQGGLLSSGAPTDSDEKKKATDWKHRSGEILKTVKELEQKGYTFEGAEASVDLMIRRTFDTYVPAFSVLSYQVYNTDLCPTAERTARWLGGKAGNYQSADRSKAAVKAVVEVKISQEIDCYRREQLCDLEEEDNDEAILEVAKGNGPVDALARALNRALMPSFPTLQQVELTDYKVRILDADRATAANVRVMIDFRYNKVSVEEGDKLQTRTQERKRITWTTVSAGPNIIAASFAALVDGYEYHLAEHIEHKYKTPPLQQ